MLEKEDLQALRTIIKEEIEASEQRMTRNTDEKLAAMEQRTDEKLAAMEQRTDEKLAAMEQRTDEKLAAMEQRMTRNTEISIAEAKRDIMQGVSVLMEQEFRPQFALLAEGQEMLREKLEPLDDLPMLDARVSALEAAVKKLNRDVDQLKKAQ